MNLRGVEDNATCNPLFSTQSTLVEVSSETPAMTTERPWGFLLSDKHRVLCLLERRQITCGRSPKCDVVLDDPRISAIHFTITLSVEVSVPSPGGRGPYRHPSRASREHMPSGNTITMGQPLLGLQDNTFSLQEQNHDAHHYSRLPRQRASEVRIYLEDHSSNGTYVNDTKVGKGRRCQLQSGDDIGVVAFRQTNLIGGSGEVNGVGSATDSLSLVAVSDVTTMSFRLPNKMYVEKFCFQSYHLSDNAVVLEVCERNNTQLGPGAGSEKEFLTQSVKAAPFPLQLQWGGPISRGASSVVYAGMDVGTGRRLALKVLQDDVFSSPSSPRASVVEGPPGSSWKPPRQIYSSNFYQKNHEALHECSALSDEYLREFYFLTYLTHHRIVQCLGVKKIPRGICIVLEYVAGGTLQDLIKNFGSFNENVIRLYTLQVLQGMEYLQSRGVVHGDLKSANVLMTEKGNLKISDFGTSRFVQTIYVADSDPDGLSDRGSGCPMHGTEKKLCGTPIYMSPELIFTQESTFASDVWALGCMVYEMAMGVPPWEELHDLSPHIVVWRIGGAKEGPSLDSLRRCGASPTLLNFLECALHLDCKKRLSVQELLKHPFILGQAPIVCSQSFPLFSPSSLEWSPRMNSPLMQMQLANGNLGTAATGENPLRVSEEDKPNHGMVLGGEIEDMPQQELLEPLEELGDPAVAAEMLSGQSNHCMSSSSQAAGAESHQAIIREPNCRWKFENKSVGQTEKRRSVTNKDASSVWIPRRRLEGAVCSRQGHGSHGSMNNMDPVLQGDGIRDAAAACTSYGITAEFSRLTGLFEE
ncbi:protein kinase, putative [Trypanosoma cruzi marinkellei]|uniref:Protein kinase, putative n=1 Tax=Trypanosoma cruzi marinkellei TaxID=85056 RepID=K2MZ79_TRYCR|nr:protein kinase, putative [Trypanosoma cruzi marinkellei]